MVNQYLFLCRNTCCLIEGDLTKSLVLSTVAGHTDKIIQARWYV